MVKLSAGFKKQMYKPSVRVSVNMGRMTPAQMRAEYTKQAKVANKRINAINKAGLYSPAIENLSKHGIDRFGLKNQGLVTDAEIKQAYKELMGFLNSSTSSRTGIRETSDKMIQNFGLSFNGNYAEFSQKARAIFDLYEELAELSRQGVIKTGDKYDVVNDLGTLYDAGIIDDNTTAGDLIAILNKMANQRANDFRDMQSQLRFNWNV